MEVTFATRKTSISGWIGEAFGWPARASHAGNIGGEQKDMPASNLKNAMPPKKNHVSAATKDTIN